MDSISQLLENSQSARNSILEIVMKLKAVEAQSNSRTMNERVKKSRRKGIQIRRRAFFKIEAQNCFLPLDSFFLFVVAIFVDLSAQIGIPSRVKLQLESLY